MFLINACSSYCGSDIILSCWNNNADECGLVKRGPSSSFVCPLWAAGAVDSSSRGELRAKRGRNISLYKMCRGCTEACEESCKTSHYHLLKWVSVKMVLYNIDLTNLQK